MFENMSSTTEKNENSIDEIKVKIVEVSAKEVDVSRIKKIDKVENFISIEEQMRMRRYTNIAKITIEHSFLVKKVRWNDTYILSRLNNATWRFDDIWYTESKERFENLKTYIEQMLKTSIELQWIHQELNELKEEIIAKNDPLNDAFYNMDDEIEDEKEIAETGNPAIQTNNQIDVNNIYPTWPQIANIWWIGRHKERKRDNVNVERYLKRNGRI